MAAIDDARTPEDNKTDDSVAGTGAHVPTGRVPGQSYEDTLSGMYSLQLYDFENTTKPLIDQLVGDASSTDISDRAQVEAAKIKSDAMSVAQRQQAYSMGQLLPSQKRAVNRSINQSSARAESAVISSGNQQQREFNQAARVNLMQVAENLQGTGTTTIAQAVGSQYQRDAANRAAKQGFASQVGAGIGAVVGGIYGGPQGASIGASVGGTAGSYVGG